MDNFGINGDRPSHPELLDHLASGFVRDGWSTKRLVRKIVLSRAYRLGSDYPSSYREIDPANRLVWRHSPRRLEAEEIRDATGLLGPSGTRRPGCSPAKVLPMVEIRDDGPEARNIKEQADRALYRSVYLPLLRGLTPRSLQAFDPVTQTLVTGQRDATTVPAQALFLLNSCWFVSNRLPWPSDYLRNPIEPSLHKFSELSGSSWGEPQARKRWRAAAASSPNTRRCMARRSPWRHPLLPLPHGRVTTSELPVDQDDDRVSQIIVEEIVEAKTAKEAAWMSLTQALYASAEFQFVR